MRFEYEKLTSRSITRRVIEHERETGKRVSVVVLTHNEWREFMLNEAPYVDPFPNMQFHTWRLRRPVRATAPIPNPYITDFEESIITVRPETQAGYQYM